MKAYTVVGIQHNGELVCESCLKGHAERSVFYDWDDSQSCMDNDGYLSPVFAGDLEGDECCDRCHRSLT